MPMSRNIQVFAAGVLIEESQRDFDWDEVRTERNKDLAMCDWRALKDVVLSTAWKEYRQALRDLGGFDTANDAADNWPVAPDE
jgi:hypothetical protein